MKCEAEYTAPGIVAHLRTMQGNQSLRQFARRIGCSAAYLSDIYLGRRAPGRKVCDWLGIGRTVTRTVEYAKKGKKK